MKNRVLLITLFAFFGLSTALAQTSTLTKRVVYNNESATPLSGVVVTVTDTDGVQLSATTDDEGFYTFPDLEHGLYIISATFDMAIEDVDILDPALIMMNIAGVYPLEEGSLEFKAADVNANSFIDFDDYFLVLFDMLDDVDFPAGKWQFESFEYMHSDAKADDDDHPRGTASGDVNGTWDPEIMTSPVRSSNNELVTPFDKEITLPVVTTCDNYMGYNFTMVFPVDLLEIVDVIPNEINSDFEYRIEDNLLKVACISSEGFQSNEMFELKVNLKPNISFDKDIHFNVSSQFAGANGESIKDAASLPGIKLGINVDELTKVYPNPANSGDLVTIDYIVPISGMVSINVYNNLGQLVQTVVNEYMKDGSYTESINELASGHYFYQLSVKGSSDFISTDRFIVR